MYDHAYGNAYTVTSAQRHAEDTSTRHDADHRRARFSALKWDTVFTVSFFVPIYLIYHRIVVLNLNETYSNYIND